MLVFAGFNPRFFAAVLAGMHSLTLWVKIHKNEHRLKLNVVKLKKIVQLFFLSNGILLSKLGPSPYRGKDSICLEVLQLKLSLYLAAEGHPTAEGDPLILFIFLALRRFTW